MWKVTKNRFELRKVKIMLVVLLVQVWSKDDRMYLKTSHHMWPDLTILCSLKMELWHRLVWYCCIWRITSYLLDRTCVFYMIHVLVQLFDDVLLKPLIPNMHFILQHFMHNSRNIIFQALENTSPLKDWRWIWLWMGFDPQGQPLLNI